MHSATDVQQFHKQAQSETTKKCLDAVRLDRKEDTDGIYTRHREKDQALVDELFPMPVLIDTATGDRGNMEQGSVAAGAPRGRAISAAVKIGEVRQNGNLVWFPVGDAQVIVSYKEGLDANSAQPQSITVASKSGLMEFDLRENGSYGISLDGKTHENLRIGVRLCQVTGEIHFSNRKNLTGYLAADGILHGNIEPYLINDESLGRQVGVDPGRPGLYLAHEQPQPASKQPELNGAY